MEVTVVNVLEALARELRQRGYELAIILHGNDPEASLLAYFSGVPYIIGSARSPLSCVYSAAVAFSNPDEHAIERRLDYVRLLGADTTDKRMDLFLPPDETERAAAILTKNFGEIPPLLLALHPTGSDPYKWWPAASFIELGNFLYESYHAPLLIISGANDRPQAEAGPSCRRSWAPGASRAASWRPKWVPRRTLRGWSVSNG